MKKNYLIFLILQFVFAIAHSQTSDWVWARGFKGTEAKYNLAKAVCTDKSGNVYMAGTFASSTMVLGTTTLVNSGFSTMFIAKFNSAGTLLWAKNASGGDNNMINDICTDEQKNIYITGNYNSDSLQMFGITTSSMHGYGDMFVAKLDSSGNGIWVKNAGGTLMTDGKGVCVDANGNVYVGGFYKYDVYFDSYYITDGNPYCTGEIFIAKYSSSGFFQWAKTAGGNSADECRDICLDKNNNIIITGYSTSDTVKFGPISLPNGASKNFIVAKYTPGGSPMWAVNSGAGLQAGGNGVCCDSKDNIYVAGCDHTQQGDQSTRISKYNKFGVHQWTKMGGGEVQDVANDLCIDAADNIYMTGFSYSDTTQFGSTKLITPSGCAFLARYDTAGNLYKAWANGAMHDWGMAVCADKQGNIYEAGVHWKNIAFSSTTLTNTTMNAQFAYVAKLSGSVAPTPTVPSTTGFSDSPIALNSAKVFPNPANGRFEVRLNLAEESDISATLYNLLGERVTAPVKFHSPGAETRFSIENGNLASGVYILRIDGVSWAIEEKVLLSN